MSRFLHFYNNNSLKLSGFFINQECITRVVVENFGRFARRYRDTKLFHFSVNVSKLSVVQHFNCSNTNISVSSDLCVRGSTNHMVSCNHNTVGSHVLKRIKS